MKISVYLIIGSTVNFFLVFAFTHNKFTHRKHLIKSKQETRKNMVSERPISKPRKNMVSERPISKPRILDVILNDAVRKIMDGMALENAKKRIFLPIITNNTLQKLSDDIISMVDRTVQHRSSKQHLPTKLSKKALLHMLTTTASVRSMTGASDGETCNRLLE